MMLSGFISDVFNLRENIRGSQSATYFSIQGQIVWLLCCSKVWFVGAYFYISMYTTVANLHYAVTLENGQLTAQCRLAV